MKRFISIVMLTIVLCVSSFEGPVMAANKNEVTWQPQSNKVKVGDKTYFFDWSYDIPRVRFLCQSKSGKISVIRKIPLKEIGFSPDTPPNIDIICCYGKYLYIHSCWDMEESATYRISIKDGKMKEIKIVGNMCPCYSYKNRYIIFMTDTGGDYSPYELMVYDVKTGKKKCINKNTGHNFMKGGYIYYSKVPERYYAVECTCHADIYRYNIKNGKTTALAKSVLMSDIYEINSDYMAYKIEPNSCKVKEFSSGKKVFPKDGKYRVVVNRAESNRKKAYSYSARIKNNTLTVYGSYETKGKKDAKENDMYKFALAPSCKIGLYEDITIEYTNASYFNEICEKSDYVADMVLTVKNKKVTNIILYP